MIEFTATIEAAGRGGAFVTVPPHILDELGGGGRIPVNASFDGIAYQGSVVSMGDQKIIGVLKAIRAELGKNDGDDIVVTLARDESERSVVIPAELKSAFESNGAALEVFEKLSYSHQREHVNNINEAKKPSTRVRRAEKTVERLLSQTGESSAG